MADPRIKHKEIPLNGKLITAEPASIGMNFQTLKNMRYTDTHIKGIAGMAKINTTAISTYPEVTSGFHFYKTQPSESHILVQCESTANTTARIMEHTADIPATGAFSSTILMTASSGFGKGYFCNAPDGQVIYCNGVDSAMWGGNEQKVGAFIQCSAALASQFDTPTAAKHYTDQMNNTKSDSLNVATVGGSYKTFLVGCPRPASGVTFYVSSANTSSNTLTVQESTNGVWNTLTVLTDTTRISGKSFAQGGKVTWASTVSTTKPKFLEGYYLYWYQFTISAGSAGIYHVTLDMPFQGIIDMWDGVYGAITKFYVYTSSRNDKTTNVLKEDFDSLSPSTYASISSLVGTTQYMEVGFTEKQTGLYFSLPPDYVNSHVAATYSQGTITLGGMPTTAQTFTVDTQTFTFADARTSAGTVTIGTSAPETVVNIVAAITADLDTVTAADSTGDTVLVTSVVSGDAGNSIVFTNVDSSNLTFDGTGTLGGTTIGINGGLATVYYWNGAAYATVGTVSDGTSTSGVSMTKSGVMVWENSNISLEQKKQYTNTAPLYFYKVVFDQTLDSSVYIDAIGGIPAPKEISHWKFPVFAQGRILLCSDMSGEKNKALCSSKYMPQVYNGADSVSVYFGEEGELTCGTEIFSQFGSSLYSLILMFKDNETWIMAGTDIEEWENNIFLLSSTIGCPAPHTLKTINLAAEPGAGINRALAIWQGANGVFMSDGRAPIPIHGDIKEYFDPMDTRCILSSKLGDSVGFIDPVRQEYHLLIASGSGATSLNTELVYDIHRNKWFEIERSTDLQYGLLVHDTDGADYTYGFLNTGYMMRLEYGTTDNGSDITHTFQTGDFALEGLGNETRISHLDLFTVAKTTTSNSATCTYYADTATSGTAKTMSPARSGYRIAAPYFDEKFNATPYQSLKFTMVTNDETCGFEPLAIVEAYHPVHQDE